MILFGCVIWIWANVRRINPTFFLGCLLRCVFRFFWGNPQTIGDIGASLLKMTNHLDDLEFPICFPVFQVFPRVFPISPGVFHGFIRVFHGLPRVFLGFFLRFPSCFHIDPPIPKVCAGWRRAANSGELWSVATPGLSRGSRNPAIR